MWSTPIGSRIIPAIISARAQICGSSISTPARPALSHSSPPPYLRRSSSACSCRQQSLHLLGALIGSPASPSPVVSQMRHNKSLLIALLDSVAAMSECLVGCWKRLYSMHTLNGGHGGALTEMFWKRIPKTRALVSKPFTRVSTVSTFLLRLRAHWTYVVHTNDGCIRNALVSLLLPMCSLTAALNGQVEVETRLTPDSVRGERPLKRS